MRPATWRTEPAALLFAGYSRSSRTAYGLLAAVVQQRLTTSQRLLREIDRMPPLRWAKRFRATLTMVAEGSHSLGEMRVVHMCFDHGLPVPDRQTPRIDAAGHLRYTDAQWRLPGGKVVVLEVDGGFHMDVEQWEADISRERDLVVTGAIVLRCTARELIDEPEKVAASLRSVGVGESSA
jgi:hypothetical protein